MLHYSTYVSTPISTGHGLTALTTTIQLAPHDPTRIHPPSDWPIR